MVQRLCFSINVQNLSHKFAFQRSPAVPAVKTPVGAVARNTGVAYLWSRCLIMSKKRRCTIAGITVLFSQYLRCNCAEYNHTLLHSTQSCTISQLHKLHLTRLHSPSHKTISCCLESRINFALIYIGFLIH